MKYKKKKFFEKIIIYLILTIIFFCLNYFRDNIYKEFQLYETKEVPIKGEIIYKGIKIKNYPNKLKILNNFAYISAYDEVRQNPAWVSYRLYRVQEKKYSKRPKFRLDKRSPKVSPKDYTNSGFSRGHLAPNYSISLRYGKEAQEETFLMTNIVPQKASLNEGIWKELEIKESDLYADKFSQAWIITGPIYKKEIPDRFFKNSNIEIPDEFFKIIIWENNKHTDAIAYLIPNQNNLKVLKDYKVSINKIEDLSGFDFMYELDDIEEEKIESKI